MDNRLLTEKEMRKLAHEYFKIGSNKNSLQAGHWIGLVEYQCKAQAEISFPLGKQAGIKEVVEYLGVYENELGFCEIGNHTPYAKLKEWGIL